MYTCSDCEAVGPDFRFSSEYYSPVDFLHGKISSRIWIVGINPKKEKGDKFHNRPKTELENYFNDKFNDKSKIHSYFNDFKKVSMRLYNLLGE